MVTGVTGKGGAPVVPLVKMVYSPGGDIVTALLLLEGDNSVRGMIGPHKTVMKAHVQVRNHLLYKPKLYIYLSVWYFNTDCL